MKHTLRLHTSTETHNKPLPDVALPRLRSALDNIEFSVDTEAHIIPERESIGQPRHERIVCKFEIDQTDAKEIAVSNLANEILFDVPWHVIYHKEDGGGWTEIARYGDVPNTL